MTGAETAELLHDTVEDSYFEHLIGVGELKKIWISFRAQMIAAELPDVSGLNEYAAAYWGFSEKDKIAIWNYEHSEWDEYAALESSDVWNEYALYLDYESGLWKLCQNGVTVAENLPLSSDHGVTFSRFRVQQERVDYESEVKRALFDDFVISTVEPIGLDFDGDGLPNEWERNNAFDPEDTADALSDQDNDGLTAIDEYRIGSDHLDDDSDNDSLLDGFEANIGFDPLDDQDFLRDADEDDLPDWWEISNGLDATTVADRDLDADGDTLTNVQEYTLGTNPNLIDTDGDFTHDGYEHVWLDPLSADDQLVDSD